MTANDSRRNANSAFAGVLTAIVVFVLLAAAEAFKLFPAMPQINEAPLTTFVVMILLFAISGAILGISKKNPSRTKQWYPIEAYCLAVVLTSPVLLALAMWDPFV